MPDARLRKTKQDGRRLPGIDCRRHEDPDHQGIPHAPFRELAYHPARIQINDPRPGRSGPGESGDACCPYPGRPGACGKTVRFDTFSATGSVCLPCR